MGHRPVAGCSLCRPWWGWRPHHSRPGARSGSPWLRESCFPRWRQHVRGVVWKSKSSVSG